jgi:hypothetical protein
MDAVEPHQVGVGLDRPEVVDRHDFDVGPARLDDGPQDVAADAAEPVDRDTYGLGLLTPRSILLCAVAGLSGPGVRRR